MLVLGQGLYYGGSVTWAAVANDDNMVTGRGVGVVWDLPSYSYFQKTDLKKGYNFFSIGLNNNYEAFDVYDLTKNYPDAVNCRRAWAIHYNANRYSVLTENNGYVYDSSGSRVTWLVKDVNSGSVVLNSGTLKFSGSEVTSSDFDLYDSYDKTTRKKLDLTDVHVVLGSWDPWLWLETEQDWEKLKPGIGYFIYVYNDCSLGVRGNSFVRLEDLGEDSSGKLKKGWNLIGHTYYPNALFSSAGSCYISGLFNFSDQQYVQPSTSTMKSGGAFFAYVDKECRLESGKGMFSLSKLKSQKSEDELAILEHNGKTFVAWQEEDPTLGPQLWTGVAEDSDFFLGTMRSNGVVNKIKAIKPRIFVNNDKFYVAWLGNDFWGSSAAYVGVLSDNDKWVYNDFSLASEDFNPLFRYSEDSGYVYLNIGRSSGSIDLFAMTDNPSNLKYITVDFADKLYDFDILIDNSYVYAIWAVEKVNSDDIEVWAGAIREGQTSFAESKVKLASGTSEKSSLSLKKDGGKVLYEFKDGSSLVSGSYSEHGLGPEPATLQTGLVLSLELDAAKADEKGFPDSSGNNNYMVNHGALEHYEGISGTSLDFGGVDDYAEIPDSESLSSYGELSISMWCFIDLYDNKQTYPSGYGNSYNRNGKECMLSKLTFNSGYQLYFDTHGSKGDKYVNTKHNFKFIAPPKFSVESEEVDSGWHHVVVVHDLVSTKIYVDGELSAKTTYSPDSAGEIKTNDEPLWLGRYKRQTWKTLEYFVPGRMDKIKIWNRSLSPEEVRQVYTSDLAQKSETADDPYSWKGSVSTKHFVALDNNADGKRVFVFDSNGVPLKSLDLPHDTKYIAPASNGNIIITQPEKVSELDFNGNTVWEYKLTVLESDGDIYTGLPMFAHEQEPGKVIIGYSVQFEDRVWKTARVVVLNTNNVVDGNPAVSEVKYIFGTGHEAGDGSTKGFNIVSAWQLSDGTFLVSGGWNEYFNNYINKQIIYLTDGLEINLKDFGIRGVKQVIPAGNDLLVYGEEPGSVYERKEKVLLISNYRSEERTSRVLEQGHFYHVMLDGDGYILTNSQGVFVKDLQGNLKYKFSSSALERCNFKPRMCNPSMAYPYTVSS